MNTYFENIIKLKNINMNEMNDDVMIMFEIIRLSKENYFMDYQILIILNDFFPFRKRNHE